MSSKATKKPIKKPDLPVEEYNKKWEQEKNYKFVKRLNDPRFGDVTVVKNPSNNHVLMVKEKMVTSKAAATNDIAELKSRMALNHPNMMRMVNYSTAIKKELCSTNYMSRAYYEFPRTDMHKEQLDRKKTLTEFNDRELTHMTYQSLNGLNNLHSKGLNHGDIRPKLIGLDKNTNTYQLLDRFADPTPVERCQTNNIVNNKDLYMSPQLYGKLKGKDKKKPFDKQKNDMYALGMTVLNTGTMDSVKDCYLPNGEMNDKKLNAHLEEFDRKNMGNNPVLCRTVRRLLEKDEAARPTVAQLQAEMPAYDDFKRVEAEGRPFDDGKGYYVAPVEIMPRDAPVEIEPRNEPVVNEQIPLANFDNDAFDAPRQQETVVNNAPAFEFEKPKKTVVNTAYDFPMQERNQANMLMNTPPVHYTYQEPVQTNYVYQDPAPVTYVNNQPGQSYVTNTYIHEPTTYNSNQMQPARTYVVNNQAPPTQTVYQRPSQQNVTYVNQEPVKTTYTSTMDESNSGLRYVRSYQDNSYSNYNTNNPGQYVETRYESYNPVQYQSNTQVVEPQVIRRESQQEVVVNTQPTYVQNQPQTTYVQNQPQTTYVQSQPQTTYVQSQPTYVQPQETYVSYQQAPQENVRYVNTIHHEPVRQEQPVVNNQDGYVVEQRKSFTFHNATEFNQPTTTQVQTQYTSNQQYTSNTQTHTNVNRTETVEVRRGSHIPPSQQQESQQEVVKKRYVMAEDGRVIEVDATEEN